MTNFFKLLLLGTFIASCPLVMGNVKGLTYAQKDYNYTIGDKTIQLNYVWTNFGNKLNAISFIINKLDVANSYIDFKRPKNEDAYKYIYSSLLYDINIINTGQNNFVIKLLQESDDNDFKFLIKGTISNDDMKRVQEALNRQQDKYLKEYFYKYYYMWNDNNELISIDYTRVTNDYIKKMQPIASAFKDKNKNNLYDIRIVINDILNFYQSIPYDTLLEDRGAGFSTPFRLLHEDKGDCDTKLVAVAATVRSIYPNLKTIAIVLPEHVVIGFEVPFTDEDKKVNYKGKTYVLSETAGPGIAPIGVIAESSEALMRTGKYSIINL